uniref:Uncharacterized protein n=1 Tax=Avena sativa TaxID=4498 RepID=A0ACD5UNL3_AVESA
MASVASDIDPPAEPQVVVEESSSAGASEVEAPREAAAVEAVAEGEAKEEEGECGFCLYMKAGGCEEAFVSWQQCVQAAEKEGSNMVERCAEATINLKNCMDAHADYYEPVLRVEKHVSDQAEAATADADKNKVEESTSSPTTDETKKEEAVVESAASPADAKEEMIEQAASSTAAEEVKKEEAVVEKVESSSLGN